MFRDIIKDLSRSILSGPLPITLLLGLRQSGKTTLAKTVSAGIPAQSFNFDLVSDRKEFSGQSRHSLAVFAKRYADHLIVIDEVQKFPESIEVIKHLSDHEQMRFLLTGSSEIKITKGVGDSLAGRVKTFHLYPLSITEIMTQRKKSIRKVSVPYDEAQQIMREILISGSLPRLQTMPFADHASYLRDYTDALLSKDILEIVDVKKSTKVYALARFLALQIGQLVNVNELALMTELSRATVYHYLDILEQMSIIWRARPIAANARKAIATKCKIYFTDLGVRNALVNDFSAFESRLDRGHLLENAVALGLKRQYEYASVPAEIGFFRSEGGSEIDLVVKENNEEKLYEVKSSPRARSRMRNVQTITVENAYEFLL